MKKEIKNNTLKILEPIVTIQDAQEIRNAIEEIAQKYDSLTIDIKNSFSFPSTIIALLEKLKDEGKKIKIIVKDDTVYDLFKDLKLNQIFNIVKE
jgi:anti-anti-sigma regulatory factor